MANSNFWKKYALAQAELLQKMISEEIPDSTEKTLWLLSLQPTTNIINALADEDPQDGKQITEILKAHANKSLLPFGAGELQKIIDRIENENLRMLISVLSEVPIKLVSLALEKEKGDLSKPLLTFIEAWIENPSNQSVLLDKGLNPLIVKAFKGETWFGQLLVGALKTRLGTVNIDLDKDGK